MLTTAKEYFSDFINLFYPHICISCSEALLKNEAILCRTCESGLPETGYWKDAENPLMKRLWGRVDVQGAAAFYGFRKGSEVQELLHQLKYRGRKDIGEYIGKKFGHSLSAENSIIKGFDLIVPVPLHYKKLKQRGYNQCSPFAQGLSETLDIPWTENALERIHENISQTGKSRLDRWGNVSGIFGVKDEALLKGRHILLVDDVVTTGATAEACLHTILTVPGAKVSFCAIAMALTG